jgi:hypothetical protein
VADGWVGRFHIDDQSRFCVGARLVAQAMARPFGDALLGAIKAHGLLDHIRTDIQAVSA